jgi:hypothetical protein
MKKLMIMCLATGFLIISSPATALVTVDFEGIPDGYLYWGGNQNLGGYYAGLNFGPDATILDQVRHGYNSALFPPHSGDAVMVSDSSQPSITVDFLGSTTNYVEAWYTTNSSTLYMEAYDALNNFLTSTSGSYNESTNSLISLSWSPGNIARIIFHDGGGHFTLDDFAYEVNAIPAPGAILLGGIGIGLVGWLRRRRAL